MKYLYNYKVMPDVLKVIVTENHLNVNTWPIFKFCFWPVCEKPNPSPGTADL